MSKNTSHDEIIEIRRRRLADIRGYIAEHEAALAEWREEEAITLNLLDAAEKQAQFVDARGAAIEVGDEVMVVGIDADRGAHQWMNRGRVVGLGRTRVAIQFHDANGTHRVGSERLRVIRKADGQAVA